MHHGLRRSRALATLAMCAFLVTAVAPVATASSPKTPGTPAPATTDPRSMTGGEVPSRVHATPGGSVVTNRRTVAPRRAGVGSISAAAPAEGFSAFGGVEASYGGLNPTDASGAILGPSLLTADETHVTQRDATTFAYVRDWSLPAFFSLPSNEYYWGGVVAASLYKGRFVVAMPSFEAACARSWLNIAVSKTSNPTSGWIRARVAIADAWTDQISLGVSDDKVVLAINEWDMNATDCIGSAFEGSRIRVMDWADLIDGGTLTVRDVSPTPRTSYYAWVAASNVPTAATTAAGGTIRLVGDKFVNNAWGSVVTASLTGSAKAGTAKLVGLTNLTSSISLEPLIGPPASIAAFPTGNGHQDERVLSAASRSGKVWFSANATCQVDAEATPHACARFTLLDMTTSPPAVTDQAWFLTADTDTFHPLVGFTRNGAGFFTMTRSAATAPTAMELYSTYRDTGSPIAGGADEELVMTDPGTWPSEWWARAGAVVMSPSQPDTAVAIAPFGCQFENHACTQILRLRSNVTDPPAGSGSLGVYANGWTFGTYSQANFSPLGTSPIKWVRMSDSPTTEDTPEGPRLATGTTWQSMGSTYMDLAATATGGGGHLDTVEAWIQWGTGTSWSTPIEVGATIDATPPEYQQQPLAFALGTVSTTVPVRLTWSASDPESGIVSYQVSWNCDKPDNRIYPLPASATTTTTRIHFGNACYQYFAEPFNGAAGGGPAQFPPKVTPRAVQGSGTGLAYGKTWPTQTSSSFLGGSTRYATAAGATFTYSFTGRAVGFVTTKATNRGKAEVWVDGVKVAVLDLRASTTQYRQLVWQRAWTTSAAHVVRIKVLGTAGRPRVDADAFVRF